MTPLYYLYSYFQSKYGNYIGLGRNRIVWKTNSGNVVKVPRNGCGIADNDWEASVCKDDIYPHTRGLWFNDIVICFMEHIDPIFESHSELPDWVGSIDCGQVGHTKRGIIKPYDYGLH